MKTDYTLFDRSVLSHVSAGKSQFYQISAGGLLHFANELAGKDARGDDMGWRLIDRRLQALRKAGKLTYDRKTGWQVAK